jgi:acetyl/propionyl-CoA carboxylase alpha subunit
VECRINAEDPWRDFLPTPGQAVARARHALFEYWIGGITSNIPFHAALLEDADFLAGKLTTEYIANHPDLLVRAQAWRARQAEAMSHLGSDRRRLAAVAAALAASQ